MTLIPLLLAALITSGCASSSQTWYKDGGSQREFDIDAAECDVIASNQARQESALGRDFGPEIYGEKFFRCLAASGWSKTPPTPAAVPQVAPPLTALGTLEGGTLHAFDSSWPLPEGAVLLSTTPQAIGPTRIESWLFRLPDESYINLILQESDDAAFLQIDYPVLPPYRLYSSAAQDRLRWSAFWGHNGSDWVQGIGAFATLGWHRRCVIVVTAPMTGPDSPPPDGLALAGNQYAAMETFLGRWQPWLEELAPKRGIVNKTLHTMGRALSPY